MQVNADELALYIQGERRYKIGDLVKVKLTEVRERNSQYYRSVNHLITTSSNTRNTARLHNGWVFFLAPKL